MPNKGIQNQVNVVSILLHQMPLFRLNFGVLKPYLYSLWIDIVSLFSSLAIDFVVDLWKSFGTIQFNSHFVIERMVKHGTELFPVQI